MAGEGDDASVVLYCDDCRSVLPTLPSGSVQLVVTSPPYNVGQRYGDDGTGDRLPLDE
jgi:DNA modification methylase